LQKTQGTGGLIGTLGEDSSGLRCSFRSHGRKNWGWARKYKKINYKKINYLTFSRKRYNKNSIVRMIT
jgi:hypothetical protein